MPRLRIAAVGANRAVSSTRPSSASSTAWSVKSRTAPVVRNASVSSIAQ
jgi:hypothetical protein